MTYVKGGMYAGLPPQKPCGHTMCPFVHVRQIRRGWWIVAQPKKGAITTTRGTYRVTHTQTICYDKNDHAGRGLHPPIIALPVSLESQGAFCADNIGPEHFVYYLFGPEV